MFQYEFLGQRFGLEVYCNVSLLGRCGVKPVYTMEDEELLLRAAFASRLVAMVMTRRLGGWSRERPT